MSSVSNLKNIYEPETSLICVGEYKHYCLRKVWTDRLNPLKVQPEYQIRNLSHQKVAVARVNWLGTTITVSHYQNRENVFFAFKRPLLNRLFSNTPCWNLEMGDLSGMRRVVSGSIFTTLPEAIAQF